MNAKVRPGDIVVITDAAGGEHVAFARSLQVRGRDFVVVWITLPGDDDRIPWPAENVRAVTPHEFADRQAEFASQSLEFGRPVVPAIPDPNSRIREEPYKEPAPGRPTNSTGR